MAEMSATGASASSQPSDTGETQDTAEQPEAKGKPKAPDAATPDYRKIKHKLKVNEKEQEFDYDTVVKLAQKGMSSDEVFRKASAKEKQMATLFERMKEGDLDWIEDIAGDEKLTKWAEKKLMKLIELQQMSPEQRELMDERAKRTKLEKDLQTREEREQESRREYLRQEASVDLDQQIDSAFKAASLPMTPSRLERVAQYMDASLNATGTLLGADKALTRVTQEIRRDASELLESMKPEELREFLPRKVLDAIRRADVEDVRSQDPMRRPTQNQPPRKISDAKAKRMSTDDYFSKLEKRFGGA